MLMSRSNPSLADFPYPLNEKGNPIDTPEWRDANDITAHAPKPHEASDRGINGHRKKATEGYWQRVRARLPAPN